MPETHEAAPTLLDAVAQAHREYQRRPLRKRPARGRRIAWRFPMIAALIVGCGVALVDPIEHLCGVTLRVPQDHTGQTLARCRQSLLDFAWRNLPQDADGAMRGRPWGVDSPGTNVLRLTMRTADRASGLATLRNIADGFVAELQSRAAAAVASQSPSEQLLADHAAELAARLHDAEARLAQSNGATAEDVLEEQALAVERWRSAHNQFETLRDQLADAAHALAALEQTGDPTHGAVPAEQRRAAQAADVALQQDLRELLVHLTDLKRTIRDLARESAPALEQLETASAQWVTVASNRSATARENATSSQTKTTDASASRVAEPPLADLAQRYRDAATAWTAGWNAEVKALTDIEPDPLSAELLDLHERLRTQLSTFLYDAGKLLSETRTLLRDMDETLADDARHYVRLSELTRAFETLQTAHHRVEFTAGRLATRDHYQLDTALRGASGLRRRSHARIRDIDERLSESALIDARARRSHELERARSEVADLRDLSDASIARLVALQEELNLHADLSTENLRGTLSVDFAAQQASAARADLERMAEQRRALEAERLSTVSDGAVMVLSCDVLASPADLPHRLRIAGLGLALTFLTVATGQWWLSRKP